MEDPTPSDLAEQTEEQCDDCLSREDVEAIVDDAVEEATAELQDTNERLRDRVDELEDELEQRATVEWDSDDVADLWVESAEGSRVPLGNMVESSVSETVFESKLEDLTERLADGDLADEPESGPSVDTETPLEDVVALPETIAESELTANQQRARFVASGITDYAGKSTGGWALRSSEVKKVLKAGTGCEGHDETVRRVIDVLDQLGDDTVRVAKRNGERRIFVDDRAAKRLAKLGQLETHVSVSDVPA